MAREDKQPETVERYPLAIYGTQAEFDRLRQQSDEALNRYRGYIAFDFYKAHRISEGAFDADAFAQQLAAAAKLTRYGEPLRGLRDTGVLRRSIKVRR